YGWRCDELQATRVVAAGCVVEAEVAEDRGHEQQAHCCEEACLHESPIGPNSGPAGLERVAKIGANFEQRKILIHWSDAIDGPIVIQVAFLYETEIVCDLAGIITNEPRRELAAQRFRHIAVHLSHQRLIEASPG